MRGPVCHSQASCLRSRRISGQANGTVFTPGIKNPGNLARLIVIHGLLALASLAVPQLRAQTETTAVTTEAENSDQSAANKKGVLLKNLARISGVRTNQLIGYGLVVGLSGTGDTRSALASQTVQNLLGNIGQQALVTSKRSIQNAAAVLVTAELPPFVSPGDRLNVTVSSIGDARSLEGGVLVQTPLYAGNKQIYAVAQGPLSSMSKASRHSPASVKQNVAQVINGAIVEKGLQPDVVIKSDEPDQIQHKIRITLFHFDFSTLYRVEQMLKQALPDAKPVINGSSIILNIPAHSDPVSYIAKVEQLRVEPDQRARVVINVRTGTVVMGGDVRVDPVAISRGGMELHVTGEIRDRRQGIHVDLENPAAKPEVSSEFQGTSIQEIVKGLNAMGASVQDIIAILESLRDAGALHAELIVN
ncbi:MAG: flagellar basal body P-ring protein FlgI [Leptospiraceae bacterium]|nr:flagellar basal body P-ring protein FlgI [Leptospiraceae bacterium]